jgi:hypothetical protein
MHTKLSLENLKAVPLGSIILNWIEMAEDMNP